MSNIVVENHITNEHLREDGTAWPFALIHGEETIFADTAAAVIGHLIPGYDDIPDTDAGNDDALVKRWEQSVITASQTQAIIAADRANAGEFDPNEVSEDDLNVLFADRMYPVEGVSTWEHEVVPLVLITTDYAPFADRVPPQGNILWVDPSDEIAYLHSLAHLGLIQFYAHDEH